MRVQRFLGFAVTALLLSLGAPASAWSLTLGDLATADPGACTLTTTGWVMQVQSATAQYVVPPGGGVITSWSTSFGPAGAPVELVVSAPFEHPSNTALVRGVDLENLPNPIPAGNISTFPLVHPIAVQAGDLIGLNFLGGSQNCLFPGGGSDLVYAGSDEPAPGARIQALQGVPAELVNVSANLVQSADMALAAAAMPAAITKGSLGELTFQVSGGPIASATFTDTLPAGLTPVLASTGAGSCSISGQAVSCALTGSPTTVSVVVRGAAVGMFADTGHVSSPLSDPNPANNSASATLGVVAANPSPRCTVPRLRGAPLSVAKAVLRLLHCTVGKVRIASSKHVPKGDVIFTTPGAGASKAAGTKVAITVSGKPKARKHHH